MPFLPIDSSIVSNPSRLHLSIIESWMLWPHDETKRLDAYKSAVVMLGHDAKREEKLDRETLEELFDLAVEAKPLNQITELAMGPFPKIPLTDSPLKQGLTAGNILIAALEGKNEKGDRLTRGEIDKKITKLFAPQKGNNSSFVNTIWQNYRRVSHLWAAHIQLVESDPHYLAFPCKLGDVIELLWLSEEWRKRGESTKTRPRSPDAILPEGECVRIPDEMKFSR
jgi:hypothetical protein